MQFHALLAGLAERLSTRAARHSVGSDIQSRVAAYVKDHHAKDVLPYGLRFRWMQAGSVESYTERGEVVVVMDYKKNNDRNFINAIRGYTSQAFLPDIRHDLPPKLLAAAELVMQENIIRSKRRGALSIFLGEVVPSQMSVDKDLRAYHETLFRLSMLGFFDNILLNEIVQSKEMLRTVEPWERDAETRGLVEFLEKFWGRKPSEDIPLSHEGGVFKVAIILVAKGEKIDRGVGAYVRRVEGALAKGSKSVYVAGARHDYDFTGKVIEAVECRFPEKMVWSRTYKSQRRMKDAQDARIAFLRY